MVPVELLDGRRVFMKHVRLEAVVSGCRPWVLRWLIGSAALATLLLATTLSDGRDRVSLVEWLRLV